MAKSKGMDLDIDLDPINEAKKEIIPEIINKEVPKTSSEKEYISPLRNEKVIIRYIKRETGLVTNPKHDLYGGIAENAIRVFTVPLQMNNIFKNVLTNSEKDFLEKIMGLEPNSLSVYLKENNYWENQSVKLGKLDTILDLSVPTDFIKYKILLANKELIAPNLQALSVNTKATYQYVIIFENEEVDMTNQEMSATMLAYKLFGKLENEKEVLKFIVETLDGRPISALSKIDFLQAQTHKLIQANPKLFVSLAQDPYLNTKVLITKAVSLGIINKRSEYYYLASNNAPLCEDHEEPLLEISAKYLNAPKHQEIKLMIEAKIKALQE